LPPQAPAQLDRNRWLGLWSRLGAQQNGPELYQQLSAAYAEPARFYHTAAHIADCLRQLDRSRDLARRPDEVEAALWFHDAVYVPGAVDNEERSAALARSSLKAGAAIGETSNRVAALVLATNHQDLPSDPDAQLVCDIDLSVLGREASVFDDFERQIREEYAWVPEPMYRSARSDVLRGFLRRRSIYHTGRFAQWYERQARHNLERIVAALSG
jgi:predicted metal-dependent HD superfamily phosphohydrolase